MVTAVKITDLNEMAERGPIADNYWSLRSADLGLSPQQAFALAWYTAYSIQPNLLKQANLPTTKAACAELLGISRVTLDKWLSDERLAVSGVQRVIDGWLPGLLFKSFRRLERIIDGESKDGDANYAIRTVLEYYQIQQKKSGNQALSAGVEVRFYLPDNGRDNRN